MSTLDGNALPVLGDRDPKGPPDNRPPTKPRTEPKYPPPPTKPSKGLVALLVAIVAVSLLSGCVPAPGVVVSKSLSTKDGQIHYNLCTQRTTNASVRCGEVDSKVWRACNRGDYYNQDLCDRKAHR